MRCPTPKLSPCFPIPASIILCHLQSAMLHSGCNGRMVYSTPLVSCALFMRLNVRLGHEPGVARLSLLISASSSCRGQKVREGDMVPASEASSLLEFWGAR